MGTEFSEDMALWIAETAEARQAKQAARKARRERDRVEHQAARDAGLRERHARKAARIKASESIA